MVKRRRDFDTLQAALDAAQDGTHAASLSSSFPLRYLIRCLIRNRAGDKLLLSPGTYHEQLQLSKSIQIVGDAPKRSEVILDGGLRFCAQLRALYFLTCVFIMVFGIQRSSTQRELFNVLYRVRLGS